MAAVAETRASSAFGGNDPEFSATVTDGILSGTDSDDNYNNDENILQVDLGDGDDTLTNDGDITFQTDSVADYAIINDEGNLTVINNSTILGGDDEVFQYGERWDLGVGIYHRSEGTLTVINTAGATIAGGDAAIKSYLLGYSGNYSHSGFVIIDNAGTLLSGNDTIRLQSGGEITNSGAIRTDGEGRQDEEGGRFPGADAIAIYADSSIETTIATDIVNTSTGVIEGYRSGISFQTQGSIENAGLIEGVSTGVVAKAFVNTDDLLTISNSGTIQQVDDGTGGRSLGGDDRMAGILSGSGVEIVNTGTISATSHGIKAVRGVTLVNSGIITGDSDGDGQGYALFGAGDAEYYAKASILWVDAHQYDDLLHFSFFDTFANVYAIYFPTSIIDDISAILATANTNYPDIEHRTYKVFTTNGKLYSATYSASEDGYLITDTNGTVIYKFLYEDSFVSDFHIYDGEGNHLYVGSPGGPGFGDHITNSGTIDGDVMLGWGDDTLINSGEILGSVNLENEDDLYDASVGGTASGRVAGGAGDDTLLGGSANDIFAGDAGQDFIHGGAGNDKLWAGATDDDADIFAGGAGNDIIGGGDGNDLLIGGGTTQVTAFANEGDTSADDGADILYGGAGDDTLLGGGWADTAIDDDLYTAGEEVTSGTGNDAIWAGAGNDLAIGAAGHDAIGGGTGDDTLKGMGGNDILYAGATGDDLLDGGAGHDLLFGGSGDDTLLGMAGNDTLYGGADSDHLDGGSGNDTLYGGAGNDTLDGDDGDDAIRGGYGNDVLSGGAGADIFTFDINSSNDVIEDFDITADRIDMSQTGLGYTNLFILQSGSDVLVYYGSNILTLNGINVSELSPSLFIFGD